jgi:hypothetical protein
MYQIPKPPNRPNPKETLIIIVGVGVITLYNRYRWK